LKIETAVRWTGWVTGGLHGTYQLDLANATYS
jgi:hypothetical protein